MTTPPDPTDPPATDTPPPSRVLRATAVAATVGVVLALVGVLLLLRPIHSPVQDCGTVAGFLLDGRTDRPIDPQNPPDGVTKAEAQAAVDRSCRDRVADAAIPGAIAVTAGTVIAVVATVTEVSIRLAARHRRRTSAPPAPAAPVEA